MQTIDSNSMSWLLIVARFQQLSMCQNIGGNAPCFDSIVKSKFKLTKH